MPITEELGVSRTIFSTASALRLLVMSAASPLVGWWVMRWGARPVLVTSTLLVPPTFLFVSRMETTWELYAASLALGLVMTGFGDITLGAVVASWVARGRSTALGIVYTGSNLAGATLVPLVSWLVTRGSWRETLLIVGGLATVVILPFAAGVVRERRAADGSILDPSRGPQAPDGHDADLTLREALRTRSFWVLAVALAGFFFYMLGVLGHLHAALTDAGLTAPEAGGALGTAIFLGLFSKVAMGLLAERLPARPALALDYGLLALSSLLLLLVPGEPWTWLFVASFGFSYAARDVVYPLVIVECFGLRNMAPIYGALMVVLWPAGSLGEIFAGFSFERFGSYQPAFRTYAAVNLAVCASLLLLRDERKRV